MRRRLLVSSVALAAAYRGLRMAGDGRWLVLSDELIFSPSPNGLGLFSRKKQQRHMSRMHNQSITAFARVGCVCLPIYSSL